MQSYSVPVPTPSFDTDEFQKLASIQYGDSNITAHWRRSTRQAIVTMPDGSSYLCPDVKIVDSLASILGWDAHDVILDDLFLFELPRHGYAADSVLSNAIYSCEWSDYGSDRILFECTLLRRSDMKCPRKNS
jgi:hypothetical protein